MVSNDLTQGSVSSQLVRLAVPMVWGIFAIMFMSLADTYFVGQLGTDELAAMGFTFPVVMVMSSLAFGIGIGASSVIARAIGAGEQERVQCYSTQSIIMALVVAILLAVLGLLTIEPVFRLLGAPEELLPLIRDYMDIWYLGSFMVVVPMVGNAGIRASGNTRLPSYIMMTVALANVVFNPILIFGLFGLPRLELQGAALATLGAYFIALLVSLYILKFKLNFLTLHACRSRVIESWKAILRIAIPAAGTNLVGPISAATTTWMIAQFGSSAVAGYSVASRIEMFCMLVLMATASALAPFAGQNWGAGRADRLKEALGLGFRFALFWGAAMAVLMWLFSDYLIHLFTQDEAAVAAANQYLRIVPLSFGLLGIIAMVSSVANGVGEPIPALVMTVTRLVIIYIPLALLLSNFMGLSGVFIATAAANFLVGFGAMWWANRQCAAMPSVELVKNAA